MLVVLNLFKILFIFLITFEVFSCSLIWGELNSIKKCKFITKDDGNPFLIKFDTKKVDLRKFNPRFIFRINEIDNLDGIKFIFKQNQMVLAEYEVPLYSDFEYGLIKNDYPTSFTIPFSAMKRSSKSEFIINNIEVYIDPKVKNNLQIEFEKLSFDKKIERGKVSITFDDGYRTNVLASKITKKFGMNGTAFIIPQVVGEKGYLTKNDIKLLKNNGWFISSHEFQPVTEVSDHNLKNYLLESKLATKKLSNQESSNHFAYPMGKTNPSSISKVKSIFKSARIAGGGIETLPVGDIYRIRVVNVLPRLTPEKLFEICKKAILNGDWAVLMFHYLDDDSKLDLNYSSKNFEKFLKMLSVLKKDVKPYHEVI